MVQIPDLALVGLSDPPVRCSWSPCPNAGLLLCTRCSDVEVETYYCSQECQEYDWKAHKVFCKKRAYIFDVELLGSSNPKITRRVAVPSWWSFKQLHYVLQYIFLPWQNYHLHIFQFSRKNPQGYGQETLLELFEEEAFDIYEDENMDNFLDERRVKLSSVFGDNGVHRHRVMVDGNTAPLIYEYDLGDCWEHKITFVGTEWARAARPIVIEAVGSGPIEDSGGIGGWNRVKEAFAAVSPTPEQEERRRWARWASEREGIDPLKEPDIEELNDEYRWKAHLKAFKRSEQGEDVEYPVY